MNPDERKRIQKVWLKLIDTVSNVDHIIDGLYTEEVLTRQLREKINANKTETERLRALLDILPRRGDNAFNKFYEVLVEVEEDAAADILCPERAEERKSRKISGKHHGPVTAVQESLPSKVEDMNDVDDELPKRWPDPSAHDALRVNVKKVPETAHGMRSKFDRALRTGTDSSVYPMHRPVRGKCLILNNMHFKPARENGLKLDDRGGTERDQLALDLLFKQLGFDVDIRFNLTAQSMLEAIEEQAQIDHTKFDCFVCAVLTHGEKGSIYGVDGELLELDKFKDAVDGTKCVTLIGKPKLFLIQACQGVRLDKGSGLAAGESEPGPKKMEEKTFQEKEPVLEEMTNLQLREAKTDAASESTTPSKADFFLALATVEDFVSWRNENWGTFFIQALAYVFSQLAYKYELNQLMLRVNRLVSRAETRQKMKQISVFRNTLTSEFYFFPGMQSTVAKSLSEPDIRSGGDASAQPAKSSDKLSSTVAQPTDTSEAMLSL